MPNTGKPSKDCHLCRSRRVKCDLARPACQRCIKYGAECPGYRDEQELVFRHSNLTTTKKRKKRTQQASSREASEAIFQTPLTLSTPSFASTPSTTDILSPSIFFDDDLDTSASSDSGYVTSETSSNNSLVLCQSLGEHWTTHSVPMILNIYSDLDFLHATYITAPTGDGPLMWAAHLFSRTYITNLQNPTAMYEKSVAENNTELGIYLGKTLTSVRAALKTNEGPMRDDVLATIWILANFELLIGSIGRSETTSPWHLHTQGLYSIIKARGTEQFYTQEGRTCFWPAYNLVQVQCLLSNLECPQESEEWLGILADIPGAADHFGLAVSRFVVNIAYVQARVLKIMRGRDFTTASAEFERLMGMVDDAEKVMTAYFESSPEFLHIMDPYMYNMYSAACVKGYSLVLIYANFLTHHPASPVSLGTLRALRTRCKKIVRTHAQSIIDSLHITLDPLRSVKDRSPRTLFDALKLVWPLTAVFLMQSTLLEQRNKAEQALQFIGHEIGVRQALKVYPGNLDLPLEARTPLPIVELEDDDPTLS